MVFGMVNKIVKSKKKGQFASMTWNKELKTRKGINARVEKVSNAMVRFGVEYQNIGAVQEKHGGKFTPKPLKWGTWSDYPYFIEHKDTMYLRCATVNNTKIATTYFADGIEIAKEQAEKMCLASEFNKSGAELEVFTIKTDNILSIK